jgi:uncharacterized membrane protein (DUF2068 family)
MPDEHVPPGSQRPPRAQRLGFLRLIALYKFVKVTILLLTAWGIRKFLNPEFGAHLEDWASSLRDGYVQRLMHYLVHFLNELSPVRLHVLSTVSIAYAALFFIEGYGLWLGRRWGEILTIIATASLIPFEVFEIVRTRTAAALVALILNVLIVAYLAYRLRLEVKHERRDRALAR